MDTKLLNEKGILLKNENLVDNVWEMVIRCPEIAEVAKSGQFVNLKVTTEGMDPLLRRPISLANIEKNLGEITLVYAVVGRGTKLMSTMIIGTEVEVLGPVGNGFPVEDLHPESGRIAILGGGIGTVPLLQLAKELQSEGISVDGFLGFRGDTYKTEDFAKLCDRLTIATENGCEGFMGYITEPFEDDVKHYSRVYCCGPEIMMKRVADICQVAHVPLYVSMEERMGCGIGACLVCVCKTKADSELGWHHSKVCTDGPVFLAEEVIFHE